MTKTDVMDILKLDANLAPGGRTNDDLSRQLEQKVNSAIGFIEREGFAFTKSEGEYIFTAEEAQVVIMYALFLYQKRSTNEAMPRQLRWALNNLIFSQKARG